MDSQGLPNDRPPHAEKRPRVEDERERSKQQQVPISTSRKQDARSDPDESITINSDSDSDSDSVVEIIGNASIRKAQSSSSHALSSDKLHSLAFGSLRQPPVRPSKLGIRRPAPRRRSNSKPTSLGLQRRQKSQTNRNAGMGRFVVKESVMR